MDSSDIPQIQQLIQNALDQREQDNAFGVSLIPSHAHTGSDSAQVDYNDLLNKPAGFWTKYQSWVWSSVLAKSFTSLPVHDMWMLVFSVSGGTGNNSFTVRINNISTASYNHMVYTTGDILGTSSGSTAVTLFTNPVAGGEYVAGTLTMDGRVGDGLLGFNGQVMANLARTRIAGPGTVVAASNLSQIDIVELGGTSSNFSGKGVLYYLDF